MSMKSNIIWEYKRDISESDIKDIKEKYSITMSDELEKLFLAANGAIPNCDLVKIGSNEVVFGSVLSLIDLEDAECFSTAMKSKFAECHIPFAKTPTGNYFCYDLSNGSIYIYYHEENESLLVAGSLQDFLNMLYSDDE